MAVGVGAFMECSGSLTKLFLSYCDILALKKLTSCITLVLRPRDITWVLLSDPTSADFCATEWGDVQSF